jgi:hypothetical protein
LLGLLVEPVHAGQYPSGEEGSAFRPASKQSHIHYVFQGCATELAGREHKGVFSAFAISPIHRRRSRHKRQRWPMRAPRPGVVRAGAKLIAAKSIAPRFGMAHLFISFQAKAHLAGLETFSAMSE